MTLPSLELSSMTPTRPLSRRALLLGSIALVATPALAGERPSVRVHKDPDCGCCNGWVGHLKQAGFTVAAIDTDRLSAVKARLGVPPELASCHTAEIGDYVIEGHVPAVAIDRLLAERPQAKGLAVPGMPVGSPGMEGGEPEVYEVVLFGRDGARSYGRFKGAQAV
jgi:hypothetical protein